MQPLQSIFASPFPSFVFRSYLYVRWSLSVSGGRSNGRTDYSLQTDHSAFTIGATTTRDRFTVTSWGMTRSKEESSKVLFASRQSHNVDPFGIAPRCCGDSVVGRIDLRNAAFWPIR